MALQKYPLQQALAPVGGPVNADVRLPGSKSITNRALLLAALADGVSTLRNPLHSEDTVYMTAALRDLGVRIDDGGADAVVHGLGGRFDAPAMPTLYIGNSGTTVRFLTAAACLMPEGTHVILDGVPRMRERPIRDLLDGLTQLGVKAVSVNGTGCPPVSIAGGGLAGGSCALCGDISSQFLTAILQAAPFARTDVNITIVGDLVSKPYVDITQSVMRSFGVEFENHGYKTLHVPSGGRYKAIDYAIEADASNASYFMAAAAVTGGSVRLTNLGSRSIQGDVRFADVLERMGCTIDRNDLLVIRGPERLKAIDVNMTAIPDTAQTLAVVCAFADGPCRITGLASLRVKETDRIRAVTNELAKLGAFVEEGPESWTIHPRPSTAGEPREVIGTYDDHRMAMSFAVAGLRIPGVVIDAPGCVAKTFPDFWQRWNTAFGGVLA